MEEKKVIYSKRFPKENFAEMSKEIKQLNIENKYEDGIKEGESIIDFLRSNQKFVLNEERMAEKELFITAATDLSMSYEIDADILEDSTSCVVNLYLESSLYMGTLKKILSGLIVMADELDIFPPRKEDDPYTVLLSLTYHTHDIYLKGKKITDLDYE